MLFGNKEESVQFLRNILYFTNCIFTVLESVSLGAEDTEIVTHISFIPLISENEKKIYIYIYEGQIFLIRERIEKERAQRMDFLTRRELRSLSRLAWKIEQNFALGRIQRPVIRVNQGNSYF